MLSGVVANVPSKYATDQVIAKVTWKAACRISNYEQCSDRPAVRRSPVIDEMRAWGAYWYGQRIIWIGEADVLQAGSRLWLTIFHEQIHYLQWLNSVEYDGYDKQLTCLVEREALDFVNLYADEIDAGYMKRTVEEWRDLYGCDLSSNKRIMH